MFSIVVGFVAGFIDSIAGGGGLITLPYLTLLLVEPAHAVGTNKIVGTLGALTAYIIYQRKNKINWREGIAFCVTVGAGSWVGSKITPHIPPHYFVSGLLMISPIILWVVLSKDLFMKERVRGIKMQWPTYLAAFAVGIYDGGFGPGGGTFMLIALLLVAKLPLLESLTLSKLSNTFSAGTALLSFASSGYVHWQIGLSVGVAMMAGAFVGSHTAAKHTIKIVRPVMVLVVIILIATLVKKMLLSQVP